jgi:sulfate adenylyltransferase
MHRSHEYLAKIAVEVCDGVLVHSLLGALKPGDIPAEVRTRAIAALTANYFVGKTVVQAGYPLDMRYAGPREALLHALFRQNYGCSHQIVGRDHAGVGSFYGPFDAHHIFDSIPNGALQTQALKIGVAFWCYRCGGMASQRTCPHDDADRLQVSGTQLRKWLSAGAEVPPNSAGPRCWPPTPNKLGQRLALDPPRPVPTRDGVQTHEGPTQPTTTRKARRR